MIQLDQSCTIGLVGGMGPQAGLHLFSQILRNTQAPTDQNHLSTILMSFPNHICDRSAYLLGMDPQNPAYAIVQIILRLEQAGASLVGIACNTAHAPEIYDVIEQELYDMESKATLFHMPREVCKLIKERAPKASRIGLMTTNGTYYSGLYVRLLNELGYEVIVPDEEFQNQVINRMIYDKGFGLKAHQFGIAPEIFSLMQQAQLFFKHRQADLVILGCTELSMLHGLPVMEDFAVIDSTEALALALIREVRKIERKKQANNNIII